MKKILLLLVVFASVIINSCDYVKVPYPKKTTGYDSLLCPVPAFPNDSPYTRKVLLEDYTGHHCGNCPPADLEADSLRGVYAGKLITVTVHAGYYAQTTFFGPPYLDDLTSAPGYVWAEQGSPPTGFFKVAFNPAGMINRMDYPSSAHLKSSGSWPSYIDTMVTAPAVADINMVNDYNPSTRTLCVHIKSKFLNNFSGKYSLDVLLTQDSIKSTQLWYSHTPTDEPNFYHRYVLRDEINGNQQGWGEQLLSGNVNAGASFVRNYTYIIPSTYKNMPCNDNHCYVVAFIYDSDNTSPTYCKILQVEEKKVRP